MVVFDGLRGSVLAQTQQDHIEDNKQQTSNANTSRHSIKILDPYTASCCLVGVQGHGWQVAAYLMLWMGWEWPDYTGSLSVDMYRRGSF
uniref:Uncharacterized protein n=1 Tax=Oryza barthii TaxID=65489 RepID=A0A0D3ERY8_9ORYZ